MVSAITMTNANEAIGIARAAAKAGMPVVISFTVETDGRLPTGQSLADAICEVDVVTEQGSRLLHDQLRPSHALRQDAAATSRGRGASAACAPTPPGAATRS